MPRKKKETVDSLKIDFTGKMVIIVDLEGWGPMELRIDDKEATLAVLKTVLDFTGNISTVKSFTSAELKKIKKYVSLEQ
jgi:hypothetical protein